MTGTHPAASPAVDTQTTAIASLISDMASLLRNVSFLLWGNKHFTKGGYETAARSFDNRYGPGKALAVYLICL